MPVDIRLCLRVTLSPDHPSGIAPDMLAALRHAATLVVAEAGGVTDRVAATALRALRAAVPAGLPVLAAGRAGLALMAGLDGVLLGPHDVTPGEARRVLGPAATIGAVVHAPAQADELYRWRVDFALVGTPPAGAGDEAGPASPEHLARTGFRIRLAAPGTAVVALATPDLAPAALVAAGANGFCVALVVDELGDGDRLRALRLRIEAALPGAAP